jgi:hypothetical protein
MWYGRSWEDRGVLLTFDTAEGGWQAADGRAGAAPYVAACPVLCFSLLE